MTHPTDPSVIAQFGEAFGCVPTNHQSRSWSSMLFDGYRHRFTLRARDAAEMSRIRSVVASCDSLPSHIVADLRIAETDGETVIIEALTIGVRL